MKLAEGKTESIAHGNAKRTHSSKTGRAKKNYYRNVQPLDVKRKQTEEGRDFAKDVICG
jgi:hypothetical protein